MASANLSDLSDLSYSSTRLESTLITLTLPCLQYSELVLASGLLHMLFPLPECSSSGNSQHLLLSAFHVPSSRSALHILTYVTQQLYEVGMFSSFPFDRWGI